MRLTHRQREKREPNVRGGIRDGGDHEIGTESNGLLDKRDDDGGGEIEDYVEELEKLREKHTTTGDGFVDDTEGIR